MSTKGEIITLDSFVRSQKDQELKGLLLKLKNELRKEDTPWEDIKVILKALDEYDGKLISTIIPLILAE